MNNFAFYSICLTILFSCQSTENHHQYPDVKVVSAMKEVMWSGRLEGKIELDTIADKEGLQAIGPESFLTGELLTIDGKSYVSRVVDDSSMKVVESFAVSAPFLVYANVNEWKSVDVPEDIKDIKALEEFINTTTLSYKRPFAFKVVGKVRQAKIHIQNLPQGTKVSSPKEAHQGQVDYVINDKIVDILGFFSTEHQTIFTHHDTYIHMHLLTKDRQMMGHLDEAEFDSIQLLLPVS